MDDGPDFEFSQTQAFKDFDIDITLEEENGFQVGPVAAVNSVQTAKPTGPSFTNPHDDDKMDTGPGFDFSQTQATSASIKHRESHQNDNEEPTQQVISPSASIPIQWSGVEADVRIATHGVSDTRETNIIRSPSAFAPRDPLIDDTVDGHCSSFAVSGAGISVLVPSAAVSGERDSSSKDSKDLSLSLPNTAALVEDLTQTSAEIVFGLINLNPNPSSASVAVSGTAIGATVGANSHRTPFELLSSRAFSLTANGSRNSNSGATITGASELSSPVNVPITRPVLVSVGKYQRRKFKFNEESDNEEVPCASGRGDGVADPYDFDNGADEKKEDEVEGNGEAEWSSQSFVRSGNDTGNTKRGSDSVEEAEVVARDHLDNEVDEFGIPGKLYSDVVADSLLIYGNNNMQFREIWEYLERFGRWTWKRGKGLVNFRYFQPGKTESGRLGEDFFDSEDDLVSFVYGKLMDRVRLAEKAEKVKLTGGQKKAMMVDAKAEAVSSSFSAKVRGSSESVVTTKGCTKLLSKAVSSSPTSLGSLSSSENSENDTEFEPEKEKEQYISDPEESNEDLDMYDIPYQLYRDIAVDLELRHTLKFKNLWLYLEPAQWLWRKGRGLISFFYCKPGKTEKDRLNVDFFQHEDDVLAYVLDKVRANKRVAFALVQKKKRDEKASLRAVHETERAERRVAVAKARELAAAREKVREQEVAKRRAKEETEAAKLAAVEAKRKLKQEHDAQARTNAETKANAKVVGLQKLSKANLEKHAHKFSDSRALRTNGRVTSEAASSQRGRSRASNQDDLSGSGSEEDAEEGPWQENVMTLPWNELWKQLMTEGWTWDYGSGLVYQWYIAPGVESKDQRVRDVNMFDSEMAVRSHVDSIFQKSARKILSKGIKAAAATGGRSHRRNSGVKEHQIAEDSESDSGDRHEPKDFKGQVMTLPWNELWKQLMTEGWTWDYGSGLVAQWYIAPGVESKDQRVRDVNMFDSEMAVRSHVDSIFQKSSRKSFTRSSKVARKTSRGRRRVSGESDGSDGDSIHSKISSVKTKGEIDAETATAQSEEEAEEEQVEEVEMVDWREQIMDLPWKQLWKQLMSEEGWTWDYGSGLVAQWYIAPGVESKSQRRRGENMFADEDEVRRVARRMFLDSCEGQVQSQGSDAQETSALIVSDEVNSSSFAEDWNLSRHRDKRTGGSGSTDLTPAKRTSPEAAARQNTESSKKQKLRIATSPTHNIELINNASRINLNNPPTPKKPRLMAGSSTSLEGVVGSYSRSLLRPTNDYTDTSPEALIRHFKCHFKFPECYEDDHSLSASQSRAKSSLLSGYAFILSSLPESTRTILGEQIVSNGGILIFDFPAEVVAAKTVTNDPRVCTPYSASLVAVQGKYGVCDSSASQAVPKSAPMLVSLNNLIVVALPSGFRRPNYLFAVATGTLIVHPQWIEQCLDRKTIVPFDKYVLPTGPSAIGPYFAFPSSCSTHQYRQTARTLTIGCKADDRLPLMHGNTLFQNLRVMVLSSPPAAKTRTSAGSVDTNSSANPSVSMWTKLLVLAGCTEIMEDIEQLLRNLDRRLGLSAEDDQAEESHTFNSDLVRFPILPDIIIIDPLTVQQARSFKASSEADLGHHPEIALIAQVLDRLQKLFSGKSKSSRGLSMCYVIHTQLVTIDWVTYCIAAGEIVSPSLSPLFTLPDLFAAEQLAVRPAAMNRRPVTVFRSDTDRYVVNDIVYYTNATSSSSSTDKTMIVSPHKFVNKGVALGKIVEMYEIAKGASLPPSGAGAEPIPPGCLIIKIIPIEARNTVASCADSTFPSVLTPKFLLKTKNENSQYSSSDCLVITPARLCGKPVVCSTHSAKHLAYLAGQGQGQGQAYPMPFLSSSLWEKQSLCAHAANFHSKFMRSSVVTDGHRPDGAWEEKLPEVPSAFVSFPLSQDA